MKHYFRIHANFKYKSLFLLGFMLVFCVQVFSQGIPNIDSLEQRYPTSQADDKFEVLSKLSYHHPDLEKAVFYSDELIQYAQKSDSVKYLFIGYLNKGNAFLKKGNLKDALESYFKGAEIATLENNNSDLGSVYVTIADVYSIIGDHQNAVRYYKSAIQILADIDDNEQLAIAYENLGDEYLNVSKPDSAIIMFEQSGPVFKRLGFTEGIAMNIGNKGIAIGPSAQPAHVKRQQLVMKLWREYPRRIVVIVGSGPSTERFSHFIQILHAFAFRHFSQLHLTIAELLPFLLRDSLGLFVDPLGCDFAPVVMGRAGRHQVFRRDTSALHAVVADSIFLLLILFLFGLLWRRSCR